MYSKISNSLINQLIRVIIKIYVFASININYQLQVSEQKYRQIYYQI